MCADAQKKVCFPDVIQQQRHTPSGLNRSNLAGSGAISGPARMCASLVHHLLNPGAPVTTRASEEPAMTRVEVTTPFAAQVGSLARFAFTFVRDQFDSLAALLRVVRSGHRASVRFMEEETW
jgi:hypothetical protein